jgi:hypothetical protein
MKIFNIRGLKYGVFFEDYLLIYVQFIIKAFLNNEQI